MSAVPHPFTADVDPQSEWPRIRFNFSNGWSASVILRTGRNRMDAMIASVAACPTAEWGTGKTELGETEASPDEVADFLSAIAARPEGWRQ